MKVLALQFDAPHRVSIQEETLRLPDTGQVMVRVLVSAISPGTELLVYRGEWPQGLPVDETIPGLAREFQYPVRYGYSTVGVVEAIGRDVPGEWLSRLVFAFHAHQSRFLASPEHLIPLPASMSPEVGALLPNMETAISFLMDGRPVIGEQVAVFGQGIVGLLTTALLARMPLGNLVTLDRYPLRRDAALKLGAAASLDPAEPTVVEEVRRLVDASQFTEGTDLTYELSGSPAALDQAIAVTGFSGRVVIGSWYGAKRANIDLGGRFHRSRIQLLSSQVSRIAPGFTGLWTKIRRLQIALRMLRTINPQALITHRFPVSRAPEAYRLLHEHPDKAIQVVLTYEDSK
ncbi:MAG: zinc-binding alcohol dehydrogenase [Desulfomonile tiedjei]|nr:zinc-binding alcohol dehydrogenase [Desulfomonile tiedjei]